MGRKPIDETGNIYGRLTVLRMATEEEYPRGEVSLYGGFVNANVEIPPLRMDAI